MAVYFITLDMLFVTLDMSLLTFDRLFVTLDVLFVTLDMLFVTLNWLFVTLDMSLLTIDMSLLTHYNFPSLGTDLLRCESLNSLDNDTLCRILQKNYDVLVSMAPLGQDVQPVVTISPPHLGPPIPEVNSIWFKLWLYKSIRSGPCTVLLSKGIRLRKLPEILKVLQLRIDLDEHIHTYIAESINQ